MKLSVAMITYNHEPFIAHAIASVLDQKVNFEYEIVIGEDCSTDGTRAIVEDFVRRYPDRIRPILREQNVGGLRNIESTLNACRGEYVAILEGDDYWTNNNKLQKQVDFLDAHPGCAISCHRVRFFYEARPEHSDFQLEAFPHCAAGTYTLEDLLKGNFVMTCSVVIRGDLTHPLPQSLSTTQVGDWPRYALAATHGNIELMDEIMAVYRLHPGSNWSALPTARRVQAAALMLQALDKELGYRYRSSIRQTLARFYYEMALDARQRGKRLRTARYTFSCVREGGLRLGISPRTFAGLAAYTLMGSWYKVFSKASVSTKRASSEASSQTSGPSQTGPH